MSRTAVAVLAGLLAACAARADIPVPPPAGKKFVRVDHVFTTAKSYPDFDFYVVVGFTPKKVEFGPDSPARLDGNRGGALASQGRFVAVPKGAAGKFGDEKEFAAALRADKVPGQASARQNFGPRTAIDAKDPRTQIVETHAVEAVDAKGGIVLRAAKGAGSPAPGKGEKNAPDDEATGAADEALVAPAPRGGAVVAGVAAALAVAFAGLRLARRTRP